MNRRSFLGAVAALALTPVAALGVFKSKSARVLTGRFYRERVDLTNAQLIGAQFIECEFVGGPTLPIDSDNTHARDCMFITCKNGLRGMKDGIYAGRSGVLFEYT